MKINAKYVVFTLITLASLYVLHHNERFLIEPENPVWQRYELFKWWLLPHAVFGTIVLVFAPLQFSNRLRQRYTKAHRVMGRMYVVGALILAPIGAYIQYFEERIGMPRSFTVLAFVDAAMLMSTTALAFLFAFKRKIALHKQWATRSYAVALVFIAGRFVMGITGWETLGIEIVQAIIWSCLALSLLLGDVAIHWNEICAALSRKAKTPVKRAEAVVSREARAA
jgi:hypothetical protein